MGYHGNGNKINGNTAVTVKYFLWTKETYQGLLSFCTVRCGKRIALLSRSQYSMLNVKCIAGPSVESNQIAWARCFVDTTTC